MAGYSSAAGRYSPRVTVIGAGNVGSALAQRILDSHLADVVLLDIAEGRPQGIALDLTEASALVERPRHIIGTHDYEDTANSEVVVVTAGLPRKPGLSRDDLMQVNGRIVIDTVTQAIAYSPQAQFIIVTNPLDVMTYLAWQVSGLPPQRVIGMAGVLDSARFRTFISLELGVPPEDVSALVLGGHGDLMVPLPNYASVNGIPVTELLDPETIQRLIQRTRNGGAEIVNLLKTGGAHHAPANSVYLMVEAVLMNRHRILPVAAYLSGEYGLHDLYIGVPCRVGASGVEAVIELGLTPDQHRALQRSAAAVQDAIQKATAALLHPPKVVAAISNANSSR
ncbi:MAG: malate dehydrogenase [Leptolyngbya sp. SIO1E4]|nr:malate dehydrogenase [Leptolyngbya sp. SIO1E4]